MFKKIDFFLFFFLYMCKLVEKTLIRLLPYAHRKKNPSYKQQELKNLNVHIRYTLREYLNLIEDFYTAQNNGNQIVIV